MCPDLDLRQGLVVHLPLPTAAVTRVTAVPSEPRTHPGLLNARSYRQRFLLISAVNSANVSRTHPGCLARWAQIFSAVARKLGHTGDRFARGTTTRPDHAQHRTPQRSERNWPSCTVAAAGPGRAQPRGRGGRIELTTYIATGIRGACKADSAHRARSVVRGHDPVGIRESRHAIQGAQLPRFCHRYRPSDRHGTPATRPSRR
jgi:hypothetical protein